MQLAPGRAVAPLAQHRPQALDAHHETERAQEHDVAQRDHQLDLTEPGEQREQVDTENGPGDAAATGAGTPIRINSGVSRKPPPTPNTPDRNPTAAPRPSRTNMSSDTSAI